MLGLVWFLNISSHEQVMNKLCFHIQFIMKIFSAKTKFNNVMYSYKIQVTFEQQKLTTSSLYKRFNCLYNLCLGLTNMIQKSQKYEKLNKLLSCLITYHDHFQRYRVSRARKGQIGRWSLCKRDTIHSSCGHFYPHLQHDDKYSHLVT